MMPGLSAFAAGDQGVATAGGGFTYLDGCNRLQRSQALDGDKSEIAARRAPDGGFSAHLCAAWTRLAYRHAGQCLDDKHGKLSGWASRDLNGRILGLEP
jgi:hypothetical protein